jgi:hypothetical protein
VLTSNGTDVVWAAAPAGFITSETDTASVQISVTAGNLQANVKVSEQANNALSIITGTDDGLYVANTISSGFYVPVTGSFWQMNVESGFGTGQRLYLFRAIAAVAFTLDAIRAAASVSGGGYDFSIWTESGGTATRQALTTITWGSAGYVTSTLSTPVQIDADEVYYVGIWVSNGQAGSQNFLAGINLAAPQLSANFAVAQRPVSVFTTGTNHPTSVTLASGSVPASQFMPWMELVQQ